MNQSPLSKSLYSSSSRPAAQHSVLQVGDSTLRTSVFGASLLITALTAPVIGSAQEPTQPQPTPVKAAPAEETPAKAAPTQEASAEKAPAESSTVSEAVLLERVQSFYASAQDFKADFKQTYTYHVYGRKKVSTGRVFFKKPAKMRWDYETPSQRVFVADGKTLWVYEPEEAQVFKRDLSSAQLPVALRFMKGEGKLSDDFTVTNMSAGSQPDHSNLHLKPKVPSPDFTELQLTVSHKTGEVSSSLLIDPTQNTNRIEFMNVKVNQDLPDAGFSFTPPAGVRVIDEANTPRP